MNLELTSRVLDLQAAANAHSWTVRAIDVPPKDAEAMFPGSVPDEEGYVGIIDGVSIRVSDDWDEEA